jgi:hypothetical protein
MSQAADWNEKRRQMFLLEKRMNVYTGANAELEQECSNDRVMK